MSGAGRKLRRAQQKRAKKAMEERIRGVQKRLDDMPISCHGCNLVFDKHDADMIATWKISVGSAGAMLTCPKCDSPPTK